MQLCASYQVQWWQTVLCFETCWQAGRQLPNPQPVKTQKKSGLATWLSYCLLKTPALNHNQRFKEVNPFGWSG